MNAKNGFTLQFSRIGFNCEAHEFVGRRLRRPFSVRRLRTRAVESATMSVPGLSTMHQLLDTAIGEIEHWQESPTLAGIPPHRVSNVRDKLQALRGCGSVGLLRTGVAHVSESITALGIPASEFAPSVLKLVSLLDERQRR